MGSNVVRRERRAAILDVAARAGVPAATVSRTVNVPEKVAPGHPSQPHGSIPKA